MTFVPEDPIDGIDPDLMAYLDRNFFAISAAISQSFKFPLRTLDPNNAEVGDIHYFGDPLTHDYNTDITSEGFWGLTSAGWSLLSTGGKFTTPTSLDIQAGSSTDVISDMQTLLDGNVYNLVEDNTTPGYDLRIEFTDVVAIKGLVIRSYYDGSDTHHAEISLYNYDTTNWDLFIYGSNSDSYNYRTILIPDGSNYFDSNGDAIVRVNHPDTGTPGHYYYIDYVALI